MKELTQETNSLKESIGARKADLKKRLKHMRDRDREKVKGVFHYQERPGGFVTFNYYAYEGDPVESYTMHDGQTYEIPRGVAKHLNKNPMRAVYDWVKNERGEDVCQITRWRHRCTFDSMDFFEDDDLKSSKPTHVIQVSR